MKWFRLWHNMIDNPKIQNLPNRLFKAYINTLCIASANEPRGTLPDLTKYAFKMHMKLSEAQKILTELENFRLVFVADSKIFVHDWDEHQRNSDNIAVRVQRHREKSNVTGNVTETENETKNSLQDRGREEKREERREENRQEYPPTPQGGICTEPPEAAKPARKGKTASSKTTIPENFSISENVRGWAKEKGFTDYYLQANFDKFVNYVEKEGKTYVKWDRALMDAVSSNWAGVENNLSVKTSVTGGYNGKRRESIDEINKRMRAIHAAKQSQNTAFNSSADDRILSGIEYSVER